MDIKKVFFITVFTTSMISITGCGTGVKVEDFPPKQMMVRGNLTTVNIQNQIASAIENNAKAGWYVESADTSKVVAGYTNGYYYLQVTYYITGNQVTSKITGSKNISEGKNAIHKNALNWKSKLDKVVYANLIDDQII